MDIVNGLVIGVTVVMHLVFAMLQAHLLTTHNRLTDHQPVLLPGWGWVVATLVLGPAATCAFLLLRHVPELYTEELMPRPGDAPVPPAASAPAAPAPASTGPAPAPRRPRAEAEPADPNSPFA